MPEVPTITIRSVVERGSGNAHPFEPHRDSEDSSGSEVTVRAWLREIIDLCCDLNRLCLSRLEEIEGCGRNALELLDNAGEVRDATITGGNEGPRTHRLVPDPEES